MKLFTKIAAILVIVAAVSLMLFKNYFLQYLIEEHLAHDGIQVQSIDCDGLYNIDCKLHYIKFLYNHDATRYKLSMEALEVQNFIAFYDSYIRKRYPYNEFAIHINHLVLDDNQNVFEELSKPIELRLKVNHADFEIELKTQNVTIKAESLDKSLNEYKLYTDVQNNSLKSILYELYKLMYVEIKQMDGDAFAKGVNISFGIDSDVLIAKDKFINDAMPRLIELIVSEVEILDIFNQYNHNNKLSDVLQKILASEGKNEYSIKLNQNNDK